MAVLPNSPVTPPARNQIRPIATYGNTNVQRTNFDYATPSIYQLNTPYVNSRTNQYKSPNPTGPAPQSFPYRPAPPLQEPSIPAGTQSPFEQQTQQQPAQPFTTTPTGQIGVSAGASPFTMQQNQQAATTTGKAGVRPPAHKIKSAVHKKGKPSAIDKYLAKDSDYQNAVRDLTRALADFKARQGVEKTRAGTEYGYSQRTMGLQKDQDLRDIMDDAAARGIVTSGVYGQRVGDYNTSYNEQLAELGRQYNSQLDDFSSALRDFGRQQSLQREAARTAALRRRSAKLGKVS